MLNWLRRTLFASKPDVRLTRRATRFLRGKYDSALTSDNNRRHWANADGLSANAANSPEVRRILRNRARYEVANNSYARGIVLTLANDIVGTGPRLQLLTEDAEANRQIERAFNQWAKAVGLAEKLRTLRMAQTQDGETFAILISNPRVETDVQLDLRLVEAEQVTTPDLRWNDARAIDGIVFDAAGNPIEYHVLREHPGGGHSFVKDYDRIPADAVLHLFRVDRPGQSRGIPDITPALPLFAMLRDYSLATLDAAKAAAYYAGIIYTDAPPHGETEAVEPLDPIELDRNTLLTMPGGWKMAQLHAEQPTGTYAEFKREVLNEIARCLNMPFNIAAGNSASYNYASGRLDHQTYFKSIRIDQSRIETIVLDRILAAWFDEAVLVDGLLPSGLGPIAEWPHQWFWDGHEHVDPQKEANAQATRLASHTTTLADEYARKGQDWEAQLRQRAKELQLMSELGLAVASPTSSAPTEDDADVDQDEETPVSAE
ncbi:phage portal protein [Thalassoglobus polymorphus]|uniref:Phage portal protein, lambda family n=1 Tax=Thalassoglobus polymorphus TaxID=2527994 RepID=A0A517QQW8_9PLAN|nr:phage portal protein [Thalassoglobus polymorphus]QDT33989.1 Phage portal protein, lambda family [Thalassoglobus polymorphus]